MVTIPHTAIEFTPAVLWDHFASLPHKKMSNNTRGRNKIGQILNVTKCKKPISGKPEKKTPSEQ